MQQQLWFIPNYTGYIAGPSGPCCKERRQATDLHKPFFFLLGRRNRPSCVPTMDNSFHPKSLGIVEQCMHTLVEIRGKVNGDSRLWLDNVDLKFVNAYPLTSI